MIRELKRTDWLHIQRLFGPRGACGGCWCMHWRVPKGGKQWEAVRGEPNRRAFKRLVESGKVSGILAFDGKKPIGWCSFGERIDFPRLDRMKAYRSGDSGSEKSHRVWSINCFFLAKGYRGKGISVLLAEVAVRAIHRRRGRIVEAYPATLTRDGNKLPEAFTFTGPETVFQRLGFKEIQRLAPSRPLYRLDLGVSTPVEW